MSSALEPFLPAYDAHEAFTIQVRAPATRTFGLAAAFDLQSLWPVRTIFRMREVLLGSRGTAPRASRGFLQDLTALGWGELAAVPDRLFIGGAYCQPWLPDVRFHPLTTDSFLPFQEPGWVKIAWTLETLPRTDATCLLRTETRAVATDREARERFTRYWRWARFGILPIRWFLLPAIRRQAEAAERGVTTPAL